MGRHELFPPMIAFSFGEFNCSGLEQKHSQKLFACKLSSYHFVTSR
jgi:hypothetical protein